MDVDSWKKAPAVPCGAAEGAGSAAACASCPPDDSLDSSSLSSSGKQLRGVPLYDQGLTIG